MKVRYIPRHQYDLDSEEEAGYEAATFNEEESKTMQSFAEDADINIIVHRFGAANEPLPPMADSPDYYGEVHHDMDLGDMLRKVNDANTRFNDLPARIRDRFRAGPAELWHWIHDPENADEAVKLGLLKRQETPKPPETAPKPENKAPESSET
jgi:hypothetical protein